MSYDYYERAWDYVSDRLDDFVESYEEEILEVLEKKGYKIVALQPKTETQ